MKKLVIIDGKSVFYRGYYAMSGLSTADGTPTGGVYGFASLAFEVIRKLQPDYIAVAWDKKGTSTARRSAIYADYKAGRKAPPADFYEQIPILRDFLNALGWPLFECDGYEADDILGTLSEQANLQGIFSCLITSDLDMLQLIDNDTSVYAMKKGFSQIEEFNLEYFEQKYGLKQSQFLDLKALQGDSSDNIPGVAGIGPKTATTLLQEFGTLDRIYENLENIKPAWRNKLISGKESAMMSRELAKIWTDAPVKLNLEDADIKNFDYHKVLMMLKKLEFNSLVRKIPAEMKPSRESDQASLFEDETPVKPLNKLTKQSVSEFFKNKLSTIFFEINSEIGEVLLGNGGNFTQINIEDLPRFWNELAKYTVVFYDAKADLHILDSYGINPQFNEIYDIKQMAFLLNALIRDKSLAGLLGRQFDENSHIDRLSAMTEIYKNQTLSVDQQPKIKYIAGNFDFPLIPVLFRMEKRGVKICPKFFVEESLKFNNKILSLESEIFELAGKEFNVSSPIQLSKILFEELNLPTKGIKKSKTGFSTGQKELDKLRNFHPIIEKIEQFREYSKLKNTYIDALPKLVDENNRIHSTFNQDITTTGRLSSTNPNLQNIPIRSKLGRKIREGFIADEGNILISADYSQFELRLAAVLAQDKLLINDFNSQIDIHRKTAAEMFNLPINEITIDQRRAAKTINFGVLYGMSAHRLATELGTSFFEAKNFIDNYFTVRKPIANFIEQTLHDAESQGFVETFYGRKRPTPDIKSSNFMVRETAKRAAANMPIQGTEADLMKRAMIEIDKQITQAGLGEQILQIHDSILIEAPQQNAEKVATIMKQIMESISPELPIKLQVDLHIGKNWLDI